MWGLNLDLRYHQADVDSRHKIYGYPDGKDLFDPRLVFVVSKTW